MSKVLINESNLINIANSIREKTGKSDTFKPGEMAQVIDSIKTGGEDYNIKIDTNFSPSSGNGLRTIITKIASIDTSKIKNLNGFFAYCSNLEEIPPIVINTGIIEYMFRDCKKIKNIDIDFSYAFSITTSLQYLFHNCNELESISFGNIDDIQRSKNLGTYIDMFTGCNSLNEETLNEILRLLPKLRPVSPSSLKSFGLSSNQATICQRLSNYAEFIAAGWTTGY